MGTLCSDLDQLLCGVLFVFCCYFLALFSFSVVSTMRTVNTLPFLVSY